MLSLSRYSIARFVAVKLILALTVIASFALYQAPALFLSANILVEDDVEPISHPFECVFDDEVVVSSDVNLSHDGEYTVYRESVLRCDLEDVHYTSNPPLYWFVDGVRIDNRLQRSSSFERFSSERGEYVTRVARTEIDLRSENLFDVRQICLSSGESIVDVEALNDDESFLPVLPGTHCINTRFVPIIDAGITFEVTDESLDDLISTDELSVGYTLQNNQVDVAVAEGSSFEKECFQLDFNDSLSSYVVGTLLKDSSGDSVFDGCTISDSSSYTYADYGRDLSIDIKASLSSISDYPEGSDIALILSYGSKKYEQIVPALDGGRVSSQSYVVFEDLPIFNDAFDLGSVLLSAKVLGDDSDLVVSSSFAGDEYAIQLQDVVPPMIRFSSIFAPMEIEGVSRMSLVLGPQRLADISIAGSVIDSLSPRVEYGSSGIDDVAVFDSRGNQIKHTLVGSSFTVVPDFPQISDGQDYFENFHVVAMDMESNASASPFSIAVDGTAPVITQVVGPSKVLAGSDANLLFSFNSQDSSDAGFYSGVAKVVMTLSRIDDNSSRPLLSEQKLYSGRREFVDDSFNVLSTRLSPGSYVVTYDIYDSVGNKRLCSSHESSCAHTFEVVSFGVDSVTFDISTDAADPISVVSGDTKTFYVDGNVIAYSAGVSGTLEGTFTDPVEVIARLYRGEEKLDEYRFSEVSSGDSFDRLFSGRVRQEGDLPIYGFDIGLTYNISLHAVLDIEEYELFNSFFSVQKRGSALIDDNPVIVSNDVLVSSSDSASLLKPQFLQPSEKPGDRDEEVVLTPGLEGERSGHIYRLTADGRDRYKMILRLVDEYGNVITNRTVEADTPGEDMPAYDIDVDQITPSFQDSALEIWSAGGSFKQNRWREGGSLYYGNASFFAQAAIDDETSYMLRLTEQNNYINLADCSRSSFVTRNLTPEQLNASVYVNGRIAVKESSATIVENRSGGAVPYSSYHIDPATSVLSLYCDDYEDGKTSYTVSIRY